MRWRRQKAGRDDLRCADALSLKKQPMRCAGVMSHDTLFLFIIVWPRLAIGEAGLNVLQQHDSPGFPLILWTPENKLCAIVIGRSSHVGE